MIYTSTHDNDTLLGWLKNLSDEEKRLVQSYLNTYEEYNMTWKCIEKVMSSKSKLSIIQMQDFLELGSEAQNEYSWYCIWKLGMESQQKCINF